MTMSRLALAAASILFSATLLSAQEHVALTIGTKPAQSLVDDLIEKNSDLVDVLLHVTPPGQLRNLVIASHIPANLGEVSGEDDLGVARTAKPLVEVQKDGLRIGVLLQLRDAKGRPIGAIGIMSHWRAGDSREAALARARELRKELASRIPSRAALFG